jgi:N-acetylglucosaminyldiphosphoundecaprenol N-acetyl-beta-D-mannosaminyltransferase
MIEVLTDARAPVRVDVLGTGFDAISFEETVERIRQALRSGTHLQVVTGNVDFVMKARRDPEFSRQLHDADLVVADGVPIVWAASLLGTPLPSRVNGTELVQACATVSVELGAPVALVGAAPGVADRAAERMLVDAPGAQLHAISTPSPLDAETTRQVVRDVGKSGAQILLVALGAPDQERWLQRNLEQTGALVGIGVGSAFDILSGDKPRAPRWMRDAGLEWAHRMAHEPRRLARRYLIEDSPFLGHLAIAVATSRASRRRNRQGRRTNALD